jgi:hypothetical protein
MRGILDTVPEPVLAYLLEHLPQTAPHSDWIPGQLLDSTMLSKLESDGFTGFVAFAIQQDWLGGVLLYQGKPIESWRRALGGMENRAEAYRNLQTAQPLCAVRLFGLPPVVVPCIVALSVGGDVQSYHAQQIAPEAMQQQLQERGFSGAVVLENGQIGQAWFFQKGQRLLEPPLPEQFREGRLHLVTVPAQVPQSVVVQADHEATAQKRAEAERLLWVLQNVLRQQVGDNVNELLESNPQVFAETNPERLSRQISDWLEDNFEAAVLEQYRREIQI